VLKEIDPLKDLFNEKEREGRVLRSSAIYSWQLKVESEKPV